MNTMESIEASNLPENDKFILLLNETRRNTKRLMRAEADKSLAWVRQTLLAEAARLRAFVILRVPHEEAAVVVLDFLVAVNLKHERLCPPEPNQLLVIASDVVALEGTKPHNCDYKYIKVLFPEETPE